MNAELWCRIGNERSALLSWFRDHNVNLNKHFDDINNVSTEELRQLYIYYETHI